MNQIKNKQIIPEQNISGQNISGQIKQIKNLSTESILFSHLIIMSILILHIIIPLLNSLSIKDNSVDLFNSHYNTNFYKTIIVSFFINFIYLKMADLMPGKINKNYKRIVVILIGSVLLNYYISNTSYDTGTIKFMKEWIKNIGWFGIIWDLTSIMSVALLADKINLFNIHKTNICNFVFFLILTILLLHI